MKQLPLSIALSNNSPRRCMNNSGKKTKKAQTFLKGLNFGSGLPGIEPETPLTPKEVFEGQIPDKNKYKPNIILAKLQKFEQNKLNLCSNHTVID